MGVCVPAAVELALRHKFTGLVSTLVLRGAERNSTSGTLAAAKRGATLQRSTLCQEYGH